MFSFMVSFKGVFLEGMEVVFIVITFGLNAEATCPSPSSEPPPRSSSCRSWRSRCSRPLSMIPENTLKYGVGLLLASFGTYWAVEGVGVFRAGRESLVWPGKDLAILGLLVVWFLLSRVLRSRALRPRGARAVDRRGGRPMKFLKSFGQFWYDFIIGDDWKIAVAVVLALAMLLAAVKAKLLGDTGLTLLGGAFVVVAFAITLVIDTRFKSR